MGTGYWRLGAVRCVWNLQRRQVLHLPRHNGSMRDVLLQRSAGLRHAEREAQHSTHSHWTEWQTDWNLPRVQCAASLALQFLFCPFLLHFRPKGRSLLHIQSFLLQVHLPPPDNFIASVGYHFDVQTLRRPAADLRARSLFPPKSA